MTRYVTQLVDSDDGTTSIRTNDPAVIRRLAAQDGLSTFVGHAPAFTKTELVDPRVKTVTRSVVGLAEVPDDTGDPA